jgi:hypothetical protein
MTDQTPKTNTVSAATRANVMVHARLFRSMELIRSTSRGKYGLSGCIVSRWNRSTSKQPQLDDRAKVLAHADLALSIASAIVVAHGCQRFACQRGP